MEEITGLVNATGVPMEQVLGVTLLPEIIKAACSMFGAFGKATENSRDGALVQLRALDWTTNGPFQVCTALCAVCLSALRRDAHPDLDRCASRSNSRRCLCTTRTRATGTRTRC